MNVWCYSRVGYLSENPPTSNRHHIQRLSISKRSVRRIVPRMKCMSTYHKLLRMSCKKFDAALITFPDNYIMESAIKIMNVWCYSQVGYLSEGPSTSIRHHNQRLSVSKSSLRRIVSRMKRTSTNHKSLRIS